MPQNAMQVNTALTPDGKQSPVRVDDAGALIVTQDAPSVSLTTVQSLGTIATTGTFQACLDANADRAVGGVITNHGTAAMTVSLTAAGSATAGQGIQIGAGANLFLKDIAPVEPYVGAISITGTKADTFSTAEFTKVTS